MQKRRVFIQSRLADLRQGEPRLLPEPSSALLEGVDGRVHCIDADVVSELGLRVESRYVLARGTDGKPHLWLRRRRMSRPMGTGQKLAFDPLVADFSAGSAAKPADLSLSLEAGPITYEGSRMRLDVTVTLLNVSGKSVQDVLLYFEPSKSGLLAPPLHQPRRLGPIEPREGVTTTFELTLLRDPTPASTLVLRGLAAELGSPRSIPRLATLQLDLSAAPASSFGLQLERNGEARDDGSVRRLPVTVRWPSPANLDDLRFEVVGGTPGFGRSIGALFSPDAVNEAERSATGVVSFNSRVLDGATGIRATLSGVTASAALGVGPETLAPSPVLLTRVDVRDARSRDGILEILATLILQNVGDQDVVDLALGFEQATQAEEGWRWTPVEHLSRESIAGVPARGARATPVLLRLTPSDPPLAVIRVNLLSNAWAIVQSSTVVAALGQLVGS